MDRQQMTTSPALTRSSTAKDTPNGDRGGALATPLRPPSPGQRKDFELELFPRIYLNGFPKSGLHMALLMARAMVKEPATGYPWAGTFAYNAWSTEWTPLTKCMVTLRQLRDDTFLKGHAGYHPVLEQYLFWHGVQMAFIYRDLRDVLISQSYHVIAESDEKFFHPGKDVFREIEAEQGHEGVIKACLTGIGPYAGLFDRWALYAPWLQVEWVHPLRFEDMIERPRATATAFVTYIYERMGKANGYKITLHPDAIAEISDLLVEAMGRKESSVTFRKGKVGGWRDEFTPEITEIFKARAGDWLQRLGYEEDKDW